RALAGPASVGARRLRAAPSLDSQVKTFTERHGIAATFVADGVPERLPTDIETAVYRITQEALTNVVRHAGARRVRVALSAVETELCLEVEDDGVGLSPKPKNGDAGTGLIGIRERVRALGGSVSITSGSGAHLRIRLPIPGPRAMRA